jgi:hypothetical protein
MTKRSDSPLTTGNLDARVGRRQALKIGGLSVSLAALVAACGDDRTGDATPGRVGNAPKVTAPPEYEVNDVVLLRTASSLENTAVAVYKAAQEIGVLDGDLATLVERLIENHEATADRMGELTEAAGGTAWTSTNPWIMERAIEPILATIAAPQVLTNDDGDEEVVERTLEEISLDVVNLAITLENMASATHQTLTSLLSESEQRVAVANASTEEARHSASLVLEVFGTGRRVSPALTGGEVVNTDGIIPRYAIETTFGSVAQQELLVGATDENGNRTSYLLPTPAANSLIYEELDDA